MDKKLKRLQIDDRCKLIDRHAHYEGRVIDVYTEKVHGPNGNSMELEIVKHPGGAAALAVDDSNQVCIIKQFRHAAGGWILEIPAGRRDPGETPLQTAQRELLEEIGQHAQSWAELGHMWSTPGFCDEVISIYLAKNLIAGKQNLEADEFLEILWIPFDQAIEWCQKGIISDSKTLAALFYYQNVLTV